jgi:hypothetical protein
MASAPLAPAAVAGAGDAEPTFHVAISDMPFSKDDDSLNAAPVHTYNVISKERQPLQV